ncbi:MAG: hypothetical protein Fur0018_01300 [Anaerolineales bacterium]
MNFPDWTDDFLQIYRLPPSDGMIRLLNAPEGGFGALALYPSAGEKPMAWLFSPAMPAAMRSWLQAPDQDEIWRRARKTQRLMAAPKPACEDHPGELIHLQEDAPSRGVVVLPVVYQAYRLGLLVVCHPQGGAPLPCESLTRLTLLAGNLSLLAFIHSLELEKAHLQDETRALDARKEEFIAITSHELRTPLGLVLGHATFLREMLTDESHKEHVKIIIQSALRMKEIIETATQADNYQSGTARVRGRPVALGALIAQVCARFAQQAQERHISLHTDLPALELQISAEPEKLEIILGNLLQNALTFTNSGGTVNVRLSAQGGYAQIAVQDTGIGIPQKDLAHIFERFYQVEAHMTRRHGGLGLGLSVARELVQLHNGRIEVASREGEGSVFTVYLPLSE